jgi:hypothetical protein
MRTADNLGWKEGAETAVAAAATAGVAKVAGIVGSKLKEKFAADEGERELAEHNGTDGHPGEDAFAREAADIRH